MQPQIVADCPCILGEGPLWHRMDEKLYWTDIEARRLFRYDPKTGAHEPIYEGQKVGGFTIQADGSLLLFGERGAIRILKEGKLQTIIDELEGEQDRRFNDVVADPAGRVFCGTYGDESLGRLYRLDTGATITAVVEGVGCSNGMGFTPNRRQMYFTDSLEHAISLFDYDEASGALANRKVFARVEGVLPDGLTVDTEGGVWSALWDGSAVVRFSAQGKQTHRITFPAKKMTSVTFGGPSFCDLYCTSAGGQDRAINGPAAGALFCVPGALGFTGYPEFVSRIGL